MTTIYLIRHGENEFVKQNKLAGWLPGVHLNEAGLAQARSLAQRMQNVKLNAVYASPLERTMQTAEPLAQAQGLDIQVHEGLGEMRIGSWQGQDLKALRRRKLWPVIQQTPSLARFPGGESFSEAQARVVDALEDFRQKHPGKKDAFVCVTHADVIKMAIAYYLGMPLDMFQRLAVAPASISSLHFDRRPTLFSLNDTHAQHA